MTAPDSNQLTSDEARQSEVFRADIDFLRAQVEFNEIQQKTVVERIDLNDDSIELLVFEAKAESQGGDTEHLVDLRTDVFDATMDAHEDPQAGFERLSSHEEELVARFNELQSQPIETRDPAEAQALVAEMRDLVNQAHAVHEDFVGQKVDVEERISDAKVEVQAVLDSHAAQVGDSHDAGGWFTGNGESQVSVDHQPAEASASDSHAAPSQSAEVHDDSATSVE